MSEISFEFKFTFQADEDRHGDLTKSTLSGKQALPKLDEESQVNSDYGPHLLE